MPSRAKRPCAKPNCGALSEGRYCPAHLGESARLEREFDRSRRTGTRLLYSTTRWEQVRREVIARDPVCNLCGMRASAVAHHKKRAQTYAVGNPDLFFDVSNLEGVCKPCHDAETSREVGFAGNRG